MNEIWRDIRGYDGKYKISNFGNVMSFARCKHGKRLVNRKHNMGYRRVILSINCKTEDFLIHRLVANEFIPNYECKPYVNHMDGNKSNNTVDNLEWATASENNSHAYKIGLSKMPLTKLTMSEVMSIHALSFDFSVVQLSMMFDVCESNVYSILNGSRWGIINE